MMTRRHFLAAAGAGATFVAASAAFAGPEIDYTPAAFDAAEKAGRSILVHIRAPWCPTCKAQNPILLRLEDQPKFAGLEVFDVDFDTEKDAVKRFGAHMQSTLIAFKGEKEMARSVGDTDPASIAALAVKAL
ncbi:MAG: thioredoxin domain-containing protein [Roseiarcus sp.]